MNQKIHDLTMLYLQKHSSDTISVEELARLYVEKYQQISKAVKHAEKENNIKHVSF